jgi:hypothetical protein
MHEKLYALFDNLVANPDATGELLDEFGPSDADLGWLLTSFIEEPAPEATQALMQWLIRVDRAPVEVLRRAAAFLATEAPSAMRDAILAFMSTTAKQNSYYRTCIFREVTEENYSIRVRKQPHDWPIADLFFELDHASELNHKLRYLRFGLSEPKQMLQYFFLEHLSKQRETTIERVHALSNLVRVSAKAEGMQELHVLALAVFRQHWQMLPMAELAELHEEIEAEVPVF